MGGANQRSDLPVDDLQSGWQPLVQFQPILGVLVPQANLTWIHEFENDTKVVPGFFIGECAGSTGCGAEGSGAFFITTAEPDRDYFSLGLGTSAIFSGGSSAFIALDALLGYKDLSSYRVTLGYRAEF